MNQPLLQINRQPATVSKQLSVTKQKHLDQRQLSSTLQQIPQPRHIVQQQPQPKVVVAPPQQKQNLTIAQQHLTEVQGIFTKVDDALKQRSDICARLSWEISDLRIQLDYVAKTTKEQAELSASQQSMLGWSKARLEELRADHERVKRDYIGPLDHLITELGAMTLEGTEEAVNMGAGLSTELSRMKSISRELLNVEHLVERVNKKHERLDLAINDITTKLDETFRSNEMKRKALEELTHEFHLKEEYREMIRESKEMALNDLISELERSEILVKRIEYMKVSLETAKASMTAITEERRVLQDNHQRVKAQLQEEIQQIQSSSKSKEEELKTLLTAVDVAKKKEEELTKRIDQSKERLKCLEEENEDRRTRIDVTKDDLKVVMEKRSALSLELISLKSQIDTSIADNERDYELTCEALKDLHELHALDAQLHYRLETLKAEYESKLKEDEARLERLDQENQDLEAELKEVLIQKAEAEIRASLMKERLLFLEEDHLSTNFENQLTLIENERVRKLQEAYREERTRREMEQEEQDQLEYLYHLKTKELENLKLQSQHLREKETKLEEEFEMMTKSSCEPIRLTDEDIDKIEQEIQQEIEEIYLQLDAEFEEKKNRLQHTRDQMAKRSVDLVHADLIQEISDLEAQVEREKKLLQGLEEKEGKEEEEELQPSQLLSRPASQVSPQLPLLPLLSPFPSPRHPSPPQERLSQLLDPLFMQDTFPLEEDHPKPPKRHLQHISRLEPKQKTQKIQQPPQPVKGGKRTAPLPPATAHQASMRTTATPTPTVTVSASKIMNKTPFVTPPPHVKGPTPRDDVDSMDSGTISKVKSARRLIGQTESVTQAPPFAMNKKQLSAPAPPPTFATVTSKKKSKFEVVALPKSSLDDWFNDNGDL